jgi:hypothetical protein
MYGFEYLVRPSGAASANFERVVVFAMDLQEAELQLAAVTFNGEPLMSWKLKEEKKLAAKI